MTMTHGKACRGPQMSSRRSGDRLTKEEFTELSGQWVDWLTKNGFNYMGMNAQRSLPYPQDRVPPADTERQSPFLDPNGDDALTPADVLAVINDLNGNGSRCLASAGEAEGEGSHLCKGAVVRKRRGGGPRWSSRFSVLGGPCPPPQTR